MGPDDGTTDWSQDLAWFVVHLGMAPADYWQLTVADRNAIVREAKQALRRK